MDEEADLALLDQHLIKTNQLSQRMTSILSQLDTRLSRLDKTIAPLGIQPHYRHAQNLDLVLAQLQTKAEAPTKSKAAPNTVFPGTPDDETAIITRGPSASNLAEYTTSIDVLRSDLERMDRAGSQVRGTGIRDLASLIEQGVQNLNDFMRNSVQASEISPITVDQLRRNGPFTPSHALSAAAILSPVVACIAALQSSPSNSIQTFARPAWNDLTSTYSQIRRQWHRRCLERSVEAIDDMDSGVGLGSTTESDMRTSKIKAVVEVTEALMILVETETLILESFWPQDQPSLLPSIFQDVTNLVDSARSNISSIIKKAVSSHIFLCLELYEALLELQPRWEECLASCLHKSGGVSEEAKSLESLLGNHLSTLRAIALRSFPELLVDIKTATVPSSSNSNVADVTHSTIHYLERIPRHEVLIRKLLQSLGERNWLMGASEPPSRAKMATEGGILNLFVADVIATLLSHLERCGQATKRMVGPTFLLNNISHIRETTSSFSSDIIGPGAEDTLNRAFREAKSAYLAEWRGLIACLTPGNASTPRFGVGGHSERQQSKEAITAFFDRLDEFERLSRQYPLSRHEAELRDRLCADTIAVVVPAYTSFHQKCSGKNLEKYLRQSPNEIESRIAAMFR